jgi:hypothetical protein
VLSAILVHKTAHERMLVVSGTIWILKTPQVPASDLVNWTALQLA